MTLFSEEYKKQKICLTRIIEIHPVFQLIGVHKPSGFI